MKEKEINEIIHRHLKDYHDVHGNTTSDKMLHYLQMIAIDSYKQAHRDICKEVTRLEVIDITTYGERGRFVLEHNIKSIGLSLEDENRKFKIFIKK